MLLLLACKQSYLYPCTNLSGAADVATKLLLHIHTFICLFHSVSEPVQYVNLYK